MKQTFADAKIIPVLIFPDVDKAVPTAAALIEGGLSVLEVTLRTDAAWQAVEAMIAAFPQATIGVGTVMEPAQISRAIDIGVQFAVSPGFDPTLAAAARERDLFYLPGVATATEIMAARREGFEFLKFFPAESSGGTAMLKDLASPFGSISFCPTGGINADNLADYLALPNVVCAGGSWVANSADIAAENWVAITAKARAACVSVENI